MSEFTKPDCIMNDIANLCAFIQRFKILPVVPETIWTETVLIDEIIGLMHMCYLRDPRGRNAEKRYYAV